MATMSNQTAADSAPATASWAAAATLPPEVTSRLLADVDVIARRMTRAIAADVTLPAQFRSIGYLRSVTGACRDALRTLLRQLHDGRGLRTADLQRLGSMGAQQAEMGVPLEVLLAAYRLAARVVWRELIGNPMVTQDLPGPTVIAITGQVLEYLDEISGAVGAAYLETREHLMRRRDRDRDRLLQRLVAGDAGDELRRLAAATDLELRPPYAVLACRVPTDVAERALDQVLRPRGVLLVADEPATWMALVPSRLSARAVIEEAGRAAPADAPLRWGVGPTATSLEDIAACARRARDALRVGFLLDPDVTSWDDSLVGVFATLAADPEAMRRYVDALLGGVLEGPAERATSLLETLEALLVSPSLNEAAAMLGVHRHTIVYRVRRLAEAGVNLDQPAARHRLWLALQCTRLLRAPDRAVTPATSTAG